MCEHNRITNRIKKGLFNIYDIHLEYSYLLLISSKQATGFRGDFIDVRLIQLGDILNIKHYIAELSLE